MSIRKNYIIIIIFLFLFYCSSLFSLDFSTDDTSGDPGNGTTAGSSGTGDDVLADTENGETTGSSGTGNDESTDTGDRLTDKEKKIIFSYVLDMGILLDYSIADIGLSALFRFYINPFHDLHALTFGCATGIIYEHSSSNTYTLHSFPLLFLLHKSFPFSQIDIFTEVGAGPALNYELLPASYTWFTFAFEAGVGCLYRVSDHLRIGLFFKLYITHILEIIPRSYFGARGVLHY